MLGSLALDPRLPKRGMFSQREETVCKRKLGFGPTGVVSCGQPGVERKQTGRGEEGAWETESMHSSAQTGSVTRGAGGEELGCRRPCSLGPGWFPNHTYTTWTHPRAVGSELCVQPVPLRTGENPQGTHMAAGQAPRAHLALACASGPAYCPQGGR